MAAVVFLRHLPSLRIELMRTRSSSMYSLFIFTLLFTRNRGTVTIQHANFGGEYGDNRAAFSASSKRET